MIRNLEKVENFIINWIRDYIKNNGVEHLVINLTEDNNSFLTAKLCEKSGVPTLCIVDKKNQFLNKFSNVILLDFESFYNSIALKINTNIGINSRLYQCLKTPILNHFAEVNQGIIVGSNNRNENNLIRCYSKYGNGCVDIKPIADLFQSEVDELLNYSANSSIYQSEESSNIKKLNLTNNEVEWADRQNTITSKYNKPIITNEIDPSRHVAWLGYTGRQREVIAKIHQLEKLSRHKYNPNIPICSVRSQPGLTL